MYKSGRKDICSKGNSMRQNLRAGMSGVGWDIGGRAWDVRTGSDWPAYNSDGHTEYMKIKVCSSSIAHQYPISPRRFFKKLIANLNL